MTLHVAHVTGLSLGAHVAAGSRLIALKIHEKPTLCHSGSHRFS